MLSGFLLSAFSVSCLIHGLDGALGLDVFFDVCFLGLLVFFHVLIFGLFVKSTHAFVTTTAVCALASDTFLSVYPLSWNVIVRTIRFSSLPTFFFGFLLGCLLGFFVLRVSFSHYFVRVSPL